MQTTQHSAETTAKLETLAAFLEGLKPALFDYGVVTEGSIRSGAIDASGQVWEERGSCGTTACAVGWLPAVFPRSLHWNNGAVVPGLKGEDERVNYGTTVYHGSFATAQSFLGLSRNETLFLFNYPGWVEENSDCSMYGHRDGVDAEDCGVCYYEGETAPLYTSDAKAIAHHIRLFLQHGQP